MLPDPALEAPDSVRTRLPVVMNADETASGTSTAMADATVEASANPATEESVPDISPHEDERLQGEP